MQKKVLSLVLVLAVLESIVPVSAWGTITHVRMSSEAGNPYTGFKMEYLSGSIAPDAGYIISTEWGTKFHGYYVNDALNIANKMLSLAEGTDEKAFAKGWLAHLMQDRVAHGNGDGLPKDQAYGEGYSNYAAKKYGLTHIEAEFFVNGRVIHEKGWDWDFVRFAVPTELIVKTMRSLYGSAPNENDLNNAYNTFAMEYYGELAFWNSPSGNTAYLTLLLFGTVSDYDDYVSDVHCNPYEESIYLTNHPNARSTYAAGTYIMGVKKVKSSDGQIKKWMKEYAERLEKAGAIKVNRKFEDGWLVIEFRMVDKYKADRIAKEVLQDMARSEEIFQFINLKGDEK
ncbi:zinc dependent phospholipase C family protein [Archaeoglobus fulgidus]|uniref:Uncharacterized protein AF_1571 n=1 Tax=Archaeoglobus fulgidus (strain ATCC 49558 / DSM 4304 / JCM 9628 / NBRC 100126 / VC-16) TaxID=224325 RepID=Y1571_ARCFU|nr:zinc dependent phospholipase C family protein [Archaeoglobus fulgidus]O28701.1 RecName: Full=Uncharacterized protein AF_1571; Flags: Precursor [Archaeoglobus fulgidus DSM 4304]AAB89684.1 predicted coding region AF_1571 [Archaeoglobus fulgidus DSM 4304]